MMLLSSTFVAEWAARMVNSVAEGVLLSLIAWSLLRLAGRQNSRTRFAVWFSALVAIAVLPLIGAVRTAGMDAGNPRFALPSSWAMIAVAFWAVIATFFLARVAVGLWQLRNIRREAALLNINALPEPLCTTLEKFGSDRRVQLFVSPNLRVPTAIGFFKPVVIFPEWALEELSAQEQNVVLLHELAHLQRWDDWTNLAQQILKAIFFFHPAVWWIERHLTLEREMACDHFVLAETENPQAYAECLVTLAEKSFLRRGLAMAQAIVGRMRQTSLRVAEILNTKRSGVPKPVLAMVAVLALASAGEISRMPELVEFQDAPTRTAAMRSLVSNEAAVPHLSPTLASYSTPKQKVVPFSGKLQHAKLSNLPVRAEVVPTLANVEENSIAPNTFAPLPVFVVMQMQQFGPQGELYWSVQIYELTVFHPVVPVENKIPAKQI